jgi:hypothetical protein
MKPPARHRPSGAKRQKWALPKTTFTPSPLCREALPPACPLLFRDTDEEPAGDDQRQPGEDGEDLSPAGQLSSSMPSGMLSGGEGEEAGAGQQTQIAGTEFQLVGQYRSDDRVRRPLEVGEEVGAGKGKEESQPQHRLRGSGDAGSRAAIERAADPPHRAAVPCWR